MKGEPGDRGRRGRRGRPGPPGIMGEIGIPGIPVSIDVFNGDEWRFYARDLLNFAEETDNIKSTRTSEVCR